DNCNRKARHAPGVMMRGVWDHDKPNLLARLFKIDSGEGSARARSGNPTSHVPSEGLIKRVVLAQDCNWKCGCAKKKPSRSLGATCGLTVSTVAWWISLAAAAQ